MALHDLLSGPESPLCRFFERRGTIDVLAQQLEQMNQSLKPILVPETADAILLRLTFDIWMRWQFQPFIPSDSFGWNYAVDEISYSQHVWFGNFRARERTERALALAAVEWPHGQPENVVAEADALVQIFDKSLLAWRSMKYHPTFGGSWYVGGCDADFRLDDALVFVISGSEGVDAGLILRALTCLMLDWDDEQRIRQLWFYFPRRAITLRYLTSRFVRNLENLRNDFLATVPGESQPVLDTRFHFRYHDLTRRYAPPLSIASSQEKSL